MLLVVSVEQSIVAPLRFVVLAVRELIVVPVRFVVKMFDPVSVAVEIVFVESA